MSISILKSILKSILISILKIINYKTNTKNHRTNPNATLDNGFIFNNSTNRLWLFTRK